MALGKGADGQPTIVLPPRPPPATIGLVDIGNQGREDVRLRARRGAALNAGRATIGVRLRTEMELSDFVIGETFWTHSGAFRCTDIGTRVVVAMKLGPRAVSRAESVDGEVRITKRIDDDPSWLNGPPYAVEEVVFDENELGCFRTEADLMADRGRG
jgi:hypothetical protein